MSKPKFTTAALENIKCAGADWEADVAALRAGTLTPEALTEHCIDGADEVTHEGWRDYVGAVVAAAEVAS